ncbi:MAG: type IV secretion system DNA-binding domain-containing protein [Chloroflexota bacterium]|nr:type IV secretion system DNA-binding domain-containing protein [Chloroflexota bacterium]
MSFFITPNHLVLGTFGPRFARIPVHLRVAELTNHVAISGATNSGKSRLLAHLALSLIERGEGVTMLDPHGDAARLVLGHLVAGGVYDDPAAYERITYLDLPAASRVWRYTPFNILNQPFDAPTTARLVLEAFRRAWPALDDGVAPAFENAVLAGVSVLIRHNLPLVFLHDLLTDAPWRAALLADETDPTVRGFFARLERWGSREQAQYLESTLRRAFLLSFSPVLRYSLGQTENRLGSFRTRMDRGQSLIVNLALPDPDARRLLGSFLTVFMEQGALQRADTPTATRGRPHTLILDEFSAVSSQSGTALQHILEQCRKFGLGLVLASQSGGQLSERMQRALAGVGTSIVFRLGRADAEEAARRIGMTDPLAIKHQGSDHAAHPLYRPLPEQWEGWTAAIQRLKPRQLFVRRLPPQQWLARQFQASVAKLRTPDLPDPVVNPAALAAVEGWYLAHCFEVRPVIEAALANLRPIRQPTTTRRRGKVAPGDG